MILSLDGDYGVVESVVVVEDANQPMFNLTVEDVHTFAVGDGDWVVHNCPEQFGFDRLDPPEWSRPDLTIGNSQVWFGDLDEHGRATGMFARLTPLDEATERGYRLLPGTSASQDFTPAQFDSDIHHRGHLLARVLGGPGDGKWMRHNLTVMPQNINQSMIKHELAVLRAVNAGDTVELFVRPIYQLDSASFIVESVLFQARSTFSGDIMPRAFRAPR